MAGSLRISKVSLKAIGTLIIILLLLTAVVYLFVTFRILDSTSNTESLPPSDLLLRYVQVSSVKQSDWKHDERDETLKEIVRDWRLEDEDANQFFTKVGPNQYKVNGSLRQFVIACRAKVPVYWIFNQNEGGPIRGNEDEFAIYTERNATAPNYKGVKSDTQIPLIPLTHSYLANYQVTVPWNSYTSFTGNYTCHSALDNRVLASIFLFYQRSSSWESLVYSSSNLTLEFHGQKKLNLPCLVGSPDPNLKIRLLKLARIDAEGNEEWKELKVNGSIGYKKTFGFTLKTKDRPEILGRYRCLTIGAGAGTDFVNITVTNQSQEQHYGDPNFHSEANGSAKFEYVKWNAAPYGGEEYEMNRPTCCSNSKLVPTIYEATCFSPPQCKQYRKMLSEGTLTMTRTGSNKGWDDNCTYWDFAGDTVAHTFRCFGNGIYEMKEFVPLFEVKGEDHVPRFYILGQNPPKGLHKMAIQVSTEDIQGSKNKSVVVKCYYVEYFISSGLFWKVMWQNGTSQWIKAERDKSIGQFGYYREKYEPYPVVLKLEANLTDIKELSCYGPVWNSSDWVHVTRTFNNSNKTINNTIS